jgi:hypothetical protein
MQLRTTTFERTRSKYRSPGQPRSRSTAGATGPASLIQRSLRLPPREGTNARPTSPSLK